MLATIHTQNELWLLPKRGGGGHHGSHCDRTVAQSQLCWGHQSLGVLLLPGLSLATSCHGISCSPYPMKEGDRAQQAFLRHDSTNCCSGAGHLSSSFLTRELELGTTSTRITGPRAGQAQMTPIYSLLLRISKMFKIKFVAK